MDKEISIWSPVVIASLPTERTCERQIHHRLQAHIKNIEDIKIKLRNPQAELQGKFVEARIKIDVIAMTEDDFGRADLLRHQEIISERIPLREFQPDLGEDSEIDYLLQINDLQWDAEYHGDELWLKCIVKFEILALREQVVKLLGLVANAGEVMVEGPEPITDEQRMEMERIQNENIALLRKLHLYETDIKSLQQAIRKAEGRNTSLSRQLQEAQMAAAKLNAAITRKDLQICRYESYGRLSGNPASNSTTPPPGSELNLGQRLKRMFINSS